MKWVVMMMVTPLHGQVRDLPPEQPPSQRVDTAGGFVQKQDLRFLKQGAGHGQALLVAPGQVPGVVFFRARQLEFLQHIGDPLLQLLGRQSVDAPRRTAGSPAR